mgnify:CR=1 FL=1
MKYLSDLAKPAKKKGKPGRKRVIVEAGVVKVAKVKGGKGIVVEEESKEEMVTEEIGIRRFVTDPARVGVQFMDSMQISSSEWRGVRVYVERPCYVEEIDKTIDEVTTQAKALLETQRKEIILKAGQEYFGTGTEWPYSPTTFTGNPMPLPNTSG